MNVLMMAQMGQQIAGAFGQYRTAQIQAGMQERIAEYRDTMAALSASRATDAVGINEIRARDSFQRNSAELGKKIIEDKGRQQVMAAVAGVTGNAIDMMAGSLRASASRASMHMSRQFQEQLGELSEQRRTIAVNAAAGKSVQVIPKPSASAALLGLSTQMLQLYDSHQPPGSRLLGPNGGSVNDTELL